MKASSCCCSGRLLLAASAAAAAAPTAAPTHVLLMLIDDLGFADVGYHGNSVGSQVVTPTIDKLSAEGVRLEQYYVTFLCSPTRTSLLSGRYPYTIGMNSEVIVDGAASCMPSSVATIGDRLSAAGWATSAYGKWVRVRHHPPIPARPMTWAVI
jgi:arylsulfatase A-like enzyme